MALDIMSSADSKSQQETTDASGAEAQSASRGGVSGRDNALVIGQKAQYVAPGGFDLSKLKLAKGASLTINDPTVIESALAEIRGIATGFSGSLTEVIEQSNKAAADATNAAGANLDVVLDALSPLAESKQTEGESGRNKIILYIVIAIAAAVALIFVVPGILAALSATKRRKK